MSIILENDQLLVEINQLGAEITRFYDKARQLELIWKKDETIWKFQAPILFPKVGELNPNQYVLNSNIYQMPRHGFARTSQFEIEKQTNTNVTLLLKDSEETFKVYPFHFEFRVMYTLIGMELKINFEVKNTSNEQLPFELGYHPAFNIDRYLNTKVVFPTQFVERYSFFKKSELKVKKRTRNIIHMAKRLFDNRNTFIYKGIETSYALVTPHYTLNFETNDFPYLAVWSSNEQFVCIEPWSNLPDLFENEVNWPQRENVIRLVPNERKKFSVKLSLK